MNLRSALELFSQSSRSCEHGAVRFLFWWLFLHRRLRPRQRGSRSFDLERLRTFRDDHFPKALSVFIRITPADLSVNLGKPFGFVTECTRWRLSAPSILERCVTTSVPPLGVGRIPVSNSTMYAILRAIISMSSRKYFNYRLILQ